jgi:LacI family transcriptional regulator
MAPPRNVDAPARLRGVESALQAAGLDPECLTVARGEPLVAGGEAAAFEILDRASDTTAFLAYNDLMAIGGVRALRQRQRPVPASASVVGFDDVALAAYVDPPLTTISQRTEDMGRWAVATLTGESDSDDGDDGNGLEPTSVLLPVALRVRESTGPAPTGVG